MAFRPSIILRIAILLKLTTWTLIMYDNNERLYIKGGAPSLDESDEGPELPSHVLTVIEDYFRTNAHQVDLRELQQV